MATSQPNARRGPRGAGHEVRAAILAAAAEGITEVGVEALSFRQVAARAGVTPAMVPYYFSGRPGLLGALLEEGFRPVLDRLEQQGADGLDPDAARDLLGDLLALVAERSWLPKLMLATVLGGDLLRDEFLARYAPRVRAAGMAAAALWRSDLDPRHALVSVLAMSVFPFLARPVVEQAFGLELDADFARSQADHIIRLMAQPAPE